MKKRNQRKLSIKKVVALVAVCFVAVMFVNQLNRLNYYNGQVAELNGEIDVQKKIESDLSLKENVYASKEYVEQIAREKLGLVRPNEKVYIDSNNIASN